MNAAPRNGARPVRVFTVETRCECGEAPVLKARERCRWTWSFEGDPRGQNRFPWRTRRRPSAAGLGYEPSQYYMGGGPQAWPTDGVAPKIFGTARAGCAGLDMVCTVDLGAPIHLGTGDPALPLSGRLDFHAACGDVVSVHGRPTVRRFARAGALGKCLEPDARQTVVPVRWEELGIEARYVRMTLTNAGACPPGTTPRPSRLGCSWTSWWWRPPVDSAGGVRCRIWCD